MSLLGLWPNVAQAGSCCLFAALPTEDLFFEGSYSKENERHMTVYVIRAVKTGLVKVGISDSFDASLSKLRREIEVLKVFARKSARLL